MDTAGCAQNEPTQDGSGPSTVVSMSEHLSSLVGTWIDPDAAATDKIKVCQTLLPFLEEIDGYFSFSSETNNTTGASSQQQQQSQQRPTSGQLPVLEWNAHFRKAYTLVLWIRPVVGAERQTTVAEDDAAAAAGGGESSSNSAQSNNNKRIFYRFATSTDDATSVGVCVTVGDWRAIEQEEPNNNTTQDDGGGVTNDDDDDDPSSKTNKKKKKRRKLITTLTAYSLPYMAPDLNDPLGMMRMFMNDDNEDAEGRNNTKRGGNNNRSNNGQAAAMNNPSAFVTAPIELREGEWSMIGITHVFPYLKRPHWTVCINGRVAASGELAYPVLEKTPVMNFNTLFQNVVKGGCQVLATSQSDVKKKASELQHQIHPRHELRLHLATFLLSNEALTPTIQALLAQAGPTMSVAAGGCLPTLPPVANWTKGSSLEGPNVGIPLVVHGQALRVQQLAASCVLWGSAVQAKWMGGGGSSSRSPRIMCYMPLQRGTTHSAPRVGLIQPTPPPSLYGPGGSNSHGARMTTNDNGVESGGGGGGSYGGNEEDPVSLNIVGAACSIHHNLSDYLLRSPNVANVDTHLASTTKLFSLLLLEGEGLDRYVTLPFFLALPPPGTIMDLQFHLLTASLQHLYGLFAVEDAALASHLIQLLTASIRNGGGRWHETLLQNGTLHVLVSSLRQALVRAEYLQVQNYASYTDFVKAQATTSSSGGVAGFGGGGGISTFGSGGATKSKMTATMGTLPMSPTKIPMSIVEAMIDLLDACSGPPSLYLEDMDPSLQIQRTSDLALSCLFGMALDWDLWGKDLRGACLMLEAVAERYGGDCVTYGYILRSQVSAQYFLDTMKAKLHKIRATSSTSDQYMRRISKACARLLQAMLLSSLSNPRSISQGEHDVSACMGALSDCPLGSVGSHVIFQAFLGVLQWCEIVPSDLVAAESDASDGGTEASIWSNPSNSNTSAQKSRIDDDHKCQVASRLARNLLMSQFHTIIAPMLLSRTVFSGESTMAAAAAASTSSNSSLVTTSSQAPTGISGSAQLLSWQEDWRLGLLIFSWVSSIAAEEGVGAARSLGRLLLASGLAGSLHGAMQGTDKLFVSNLFLPAPSMALTVAATSRKNEWSYTDLLADRLAVMMPLLPSIVVSLLGPPASDGQSTPLPSSKSLIVMAELITAVGGAFHRVFGGMTHMAGDKRGKGWLAVDSKAVETAKSYTPPLLVVAMIMEQHKISCEKNVTQDQSTVTILKPPIVSQKGLEDGSWIEVSSTVNESFLSDGAVHLPEGGINNAKTNEVVLSVLNACQASILTTISELMTNAMRSGGGEVSTSLWRAILATLNEAEIYQTRMDDSQSTESVHTISNVALNVLCRILAMVLMKCLKRDYQWELWTLTLSAAISRLCLLIEEKELLLRPLGNDHTYSSDQILLICSLLSVLSYGRDTTGWCQLILPSPPVPTHQHEDEGAVRRSHESSGSRGAESAAAAASVMLPVLQPSLRVLVECMGNLKSDVKIVIPSASDTERPEESNKEKTDDSKRLEEEKAVGLVEHIANELRHSLMAAIVGMAFANARDVALHAMATLRRAIQCYTNLSDDKGVELCTTLLCMVAEEIRVRYAGERRRRETALFDAYEESDERGRKKSVSAAADSQAVENLILGGGLVPQTSVGSKESVEEVSFVPDSDIGGAQPCGGDDFVLFHEGLAKRASETNASSGAKMDWSRYEGLGAALENCLTADGSPIDHESNDLKTSADVVLKTLSPYLDSWDQNAAIEAADTELVKLFDFSLDTTLDYANKGEGLNQMVVYGLQGSDSAADAMSTFIELAAAEKSRVLELTAIFLPNHRYSCAAFTERCCWARYMEVSQKGDTNGIWERGIADGNRDVRSRLVTIPCSPQFKRYIPKYLDHSADHDGRRPSDLLLGDSDDVSNMDAFTRTLIQTGHLEIVDITKKEINVEDQPILELPNPNTMDDDFDEAPLEVPTASAENLDGLKRGGGETDSAATTTDETATTESMGRAEEESEVFDKTKLGSSHFNITASAFASPPDNSSSTLGLMHSAAAGLIERHVEDCLHVKAEGSRKCSLLLTSTHLILEYDVDCEGLYEGELMAVKEESERQRMIEETGGNQAVDEEKIQEEIERRLKEAAALRPRSIRWNLSELSHVYLRRYRLRDSSIELFFIPSGGTSFGGYGLFSPSTSLFLDFGAGYEGNARRDDAAFAIMKRAPPQAIKQWPDRAAYFLHEQLSRLTMGWVEGRITNFDYLLHLNILAGRSYNDTCQYPVMPWVLSNYKSEEIPDLNDPKNYRDLSKPVGALNPSRLADFIERFNTFADPSIPPFMYGSHYSTNAGVVLHFLVRLHPFSGLHRQLQGGHFDVADRLFSSVPRTWDMCTGSSAAEVKELTPEWYCNPAFLKNNNQFKLGTSQDGDVLGDVVLPPWANDSPEKFVEVMRNALESDICSSMLPDWIDLIFGRKQQGPEAIAAHNVFFYLTYYGSVDVAAIEDEGLRQATELQIAHFGQCPMQLFVRPHVRRVQYVNKKRLSFYQITSAYSHGIDRRGDGQDASNSPKRSIFGQPLYLPFYSAPMSHWVQLDAPPPGPHAHLLSVRLAGTDRCLAVDAQGVFHCFRWAWKAEESSEIAGYASGSTFPFDNGCFIAQRELPRFRSVPRLVHKPRQDELPAVAISKTLFAGRSVLLVLSDGDGRGGLAMQLVDPAKGSVRGEAVISSVHSSHITCIATDPIGTAAGHGGVGGELAIVGSSDGNASLWRFMSSHYLPLRPRVRLSGHCGASIHAVGLSAAIHVAATVSTNRLCLHSIGNGNVIRVIEPPTNTLEMPEDSVMVTTFAKSPAVAISVQGFVIAVCETQLSSQGSESTRNVISLHLFSLEGVSIGSKPLESWRGVPHKISTTPDGTAILVCSGRGVTIHRLSAITPLEFIDEWHVTESEELSSAVPRAFDIDLGPSLNRPVVAAAACSNGVLRLHALSGISAFSERHKKLGITQSVGSAARRIKNVFGKASTITKTVMDTGTKASAVGKEISKEITDDVKERGVTGFLGGMFGKKK